MLCRIRRNGLLTSIDQAAGIPRKLAPTIGIAVDPRRQNLSEESLTANVERLKAYRERVVLFPRNAKKPKQGDASKGEIEAASELSAYLGKIKHSNVGIPITNKYTIQEGKVADYPSTEKAYRMLRDKRSEARLQGKREARAKKAAEAEAEKKK